MNEIPKWERCKWDTQAHVSEAPTKGNGNFKIYIIYKFNV